MFTAPKGYSYKTAPFNYTKVPRKFKKKWKHILCGDRYDFLTFNQKLWYILGLRNEKYRDFLISYMIKSYDLVE